MTDKFRLKVMLAFLTLALLAPGGGGVLQAEAQGLTGQIGGSVIDSSNAAVPGAVVVARNTATSVTRETITDGQGLFVITNIFAGTYDLRVTLSGFGAYEQKGIVLLATERVSLAPITLQAANVAAEVTVEATGLRPNTQSGERSLSVTAEQIENTSLRGRDFLGLLQGMAGVIDTNARDAPGWNAFMNVQINGIDGTFMNLSYDGVTNKDTGFGAANYVTPSLDSIAEVKVQVSNFQAEFGRSGGANVVVVTKSGSARFSGSGAYYKRHEAFNANSWSRRRTCDSAKLSNPNGPPHVQCEKERYRYDTTAFTLGGPVLLPGSRFNENRDKLFFFFSLDMMPRDVPNDVVNSTFPSAAVRNGDFSQVVNSSGALRYIRDPQTNLPCNINDGTGGGCFPGNVIPADRIHPFGRQMLNLLPLPDPALESFVGNVNGVSQGSYNYQLFSTNDLNRRDQVVRVDWNMRPGTTFYTRVQWGREVNARGYRGTLINNAPFPLARNSYDILTGGIVSTLIHTFSSSTVLEVTGGPSWNNQDVYPMSDADRDAMDYRLQLPAHVPVFPDSNPWFALPNISMTGGSSNPNGLTIDNRYPFKARNPFNVYSAYLTHLRGSHNMKTGIYVEHTQRPNRRTGAFNGTYNFNAASANPHDTNVGWANALLGSLNNYQEVNRALYIEKFGFVQTEFFVQDNWRMNRRFTLDYGMRFVNMRPTTSSTEEAVWFDPAAYRPQDAVALYRPHCANGVFPCSGANRVALNPITGQTLSSAFIGTVVPGSGQLDNGSVLTRGHMPQYDSPGPMGLLMSPRIGFGWDLLGDGSTAIRGGWGRSFQRPNDDATGGLYTQPPRVYTINLSNLTIDERAQLAQTESSHLISLQGGTASERFRPITIDSWSVTVQRSLPFRMLLDVGYTGNRMINSFSVNGTTTEPLNDPNPTTVQNPPAEWIDPTLPLTALGRPQLLPTNLIRPYPGRGGITLRRFIPEHYRDNHSLQISVSRRLANGFSGSVAYTKTEQIQFTGWDWYRTLEDNRDRYTTHNGSRPHNLAFTYNWLIPGASRFLGNNVIAQGVLDGWQISGLTIMRGGTRSGFGAGFTGLPTGLNFDILTGGVGGVDRSVVICDPNLPRSQRTFDRQFRTECLAPPGPLTDPSDLTYQGTGKGRGTNDVWVSLGYINTDLTLYKNFRLGNRRNLRLEVQAYNAFNSTQYQAVTTGATWDFNTGEQTNANFGRISGVRTNSNRVLQLAVRFTF